MGVDGRLADWKGKGKEKEKAAAATTTTTTTMEKSKSSKKSKRRLKKSPPTPTVVQRLFDTCKEIFTNCEADVVPSPEDIERLRAIVDVMKPEDVGLTPNLQHFGNLVPKGPPVITYFPIYQCPKFSICIFCMPKLAVIPLHNHPGMTVFSKILFGSMHIKSYDWVNDPQNNETIRNADGARLAKVHTDSVFKEPCKTSILYPAAGGNMHRFTAVTSCAVLDVLGPPYSKSKGRDCAYYNDVPYLTSSGEAVLVPGEHERYAWLKEREGKPDDCFVLAAEYKGPKLVDN